AAATAVGTKALFGFAGGDVLVYDALTGAWSATRLPAARASLAATTLGTKALFGGGPAVDAYDAATGTWSSVALSVARDRMAAATTGARALFAGGTGGGLLSVADVRAEVDVLT